MHIYMKNIKMRWMQVLPVTGVQPKGSLLIEC